MYNMLVVDDEKIESEGIAYLIEEYKLPFCVVQAENGKKALEYLQENDVDVLLTDIKMPYMNGLELANKARELKPQIKIIIYSAYGEFEYAKKAITLNVVHYILKPIIINEFIDTMTKLVEMLKEEDSKRESEERLRKGYDKSTTLQQLKDLIMEYVNGSKPGEDNSNTDLNKKVIREIYNYIHENYMKDISLESVAEEVYLSPGYLSGFFKKETGQSLVKYLTCYRMEKAKELLQNTNMKIVDIAEKVGYSNTSYFCTAFKNYLGMSPARYRGKDD